VTAVPPPRSVVAAFGAEGEPNLLVMPTWRVGDVVLKPETDDRLQSWLGTEVAPLERGGHRLAEPLPSVAGSWVVEGWSASRFVAGTSVPQAGPSPERWAAALEGGRSFHRSVSGLGRPSFLDRRDSWWARADRRAWGEARPAAPHEALARSAAVLEAACSRRRHGLGESQVVHGDLGGNVLLADGEAPAVIDVSPYWRPTAYAEGVLVADALCWHGATPDLLDVLGVSVPDVARALLFRLWTTHERVSAGVRLGDLDAEARAYAAAVEAIGLS
jgi:uncharacterized protein (TIGR02569 family)